MIRVDRDCWRLEFETKEGLALLSLLRVMLLGFNAGQAEERSSVGLPVNDMPRIIYIGGVRFLKNAAQ